MIEIPSQVAVSSGKKVSVDCGARKRFLRPETIAWPNQKLDLVHLRYRYELVLRRLTSVFFDILLTFESHRPSLNQLVACRHSTVLSPTLFQIFTESAFVKRTVVVSSLVLILAIVVGCGSGGPVKAKLYPVKGKVLLGGKPLTGCTLLLVALKTAPGADDSYVGVLNDKGEFELSSPTGKAGAATGTYKVTFSTGVGTTGPTSGHDMFQATLKGTAKNTPKQIPYPKEYSSAGTSTKEVEIKAEKNDLTINL